ncbi:MAG: oligosaccharide flippase family protein [Clostridia bacterium]|nr:oligosaccharide flippase family protein [Clostridia bacterium]
MEKTKKESLKNQALLTAGSGALVRALGFGLRLLLSRALGAEALGVMELASGVHLLALAPAAAGLPSAVSRLTARAESETEKRMILSAGRRMALKMGLLLSPLLLLLSPLIARLLGDQRTLPSLYLFAPCVLTVGLSSVYDGASFGRGRALYPALSEGAEQLVRLLTVGGLLFLIPRLTVAYRAALPAFASTVGEAAGLLVILLLSGKTPAFRKNAETRKIRKTLFRLSLPLLLNRLSHTALHSLNNVVIPLRLMAGGLTRGEAMSRLGMLGGMVMPLMFLPGLLSGALSVVGCPAIASCKTRKAENRLAFRLISCALGTGLLCAAGLYALAPVLSARLYRLPELADLMRAACPLALILPVQQTVNGLLTGLGLQKRSLMAGLLGAGAALLCTWQWTAAFGIRGSAYAGMTGHALTLACEMIVLYLR